MLRIKICSHLCMLLQQLVWLLDLHIINHPSTIKYLGNLGAASALLEHGASLTETNLAGNSPVHTATLNGHVDILQEMIENEKIELDRVNHRGESALHLGAAATHSTECLQLLIREGANVNLKAADGRTPIMMASIHGRVSRTKILISAGADLEATDKYGRTALHVASFYGHEQLIALILQCPGIDARRKDYSGSTPLHMSATSEHLEACRRLAMSGKYCFPIGQSY